MNDLSGTTVGPYRLIEVIGKGGMATVYRAFQSNMDRDVALKIMSPDFADEPEFVMRFEREAQIIAQLQHPHILPVYDFGRYDGLTYLVMRLMTGGSLNTLLRGPLPTGRVIDLTKQIASALDYAHGRGIIHRDLKPTNVLLDDLGIAYLTDFGIAKLLASGTITGLTRPDAVMGTPTYMAPEQWRSEPVDARTDVYALGVIVYQMLLGQVPFASETPHGLMYQHLDKEPPSPTALNPDLPITIEPVIRRALAKNREDRYGSAGDLARDLERVLRTPTGTVYTRIDQPPVRPRQPGETDPDLLRAEEELLASAEPDELPYRTGQDTAPHTAPHTVPPVRQTQPGTAVPRPTAPPNSPAAGTPSAAPSGPATMRPPARSTPPPYIHPTGTRQPGPPPYTPPLTAQGTGQPTYPPRITQNSAQSGYLPSDYASRAAEPLQPSTPSVRGYTPPYRAPQPSEQHHLPLDESGLGFTRLVVIVGGVMVALLILFGVIFAIELALNTNSNSRTTSQTPHVAILTPADGATIGLGATVRIEFNADSPSGLSRIELRRFNTTILTITLGGERVYQGWFDYAANATGEHDLEVIAYSGTASSPPATLRLVVQ